MCVCVLSKVAYKCSGNHLKTLESNSSWLYTKIIRTDVFLGTLSALWMAKGERGHKLSGIIIMNWLLEANHDERVSYIFSYK